MGHLNRQQSIRSTKDPIFSKITLPGSKQITYRAIILAALAEGVSEISGMAVNANIITFLNALHQLGIVTQLDEKSKTCIVAGCNGNLPKKQASIWLNRSPTLARFIITLGAACPGVFFFDGLCDESQASLLQTLTEQGAQILPNDAKKTPFTVIGSNALTGGHITFNDPATRLADSRLISPLLLIAPFSRSPFIINLPNQQAAFPAIDLTCAMMAEFSVLVHHMQQDQLIVPIPQRYQAKDYVVEPDLSLASYFFAAAAVTSGEVTISGVKRSTSKQSNIKLLSSLEKMGCQVLESPHGVTLKGPAQLHGIEISMREFSDTFLALAAIAPFSKSPLRMTHIGPLSTQETAYLTQIKTLLINLNVLVETGADWIKIFPSTPQAHKLPIIAVNPSLAMTCALIGLKTPGITIENAACVKKVYPDFFNQWDRLSASTTIPA
ncbi:MAG TPA: hypothetical protein VHZ76_03760 [Gammaproteobacteria bacterium]|nr:hypothetical protein [Gammaproteobacteria bacterium]